VTPALLLPAGLAALAAVIVPLAIHIARRSEQRPTDFAALRWLRQKPRPRHRLRFDEWPLLALRLLLVALVALLIAHPVLFGSAGRTPWVAVMPGVDPAPYRGDDAEVRWLAPGFPDIDRPAPGGGEFASLLRQLDSELAPGVALTVVVPAQLQGADAERPRLSRTVTWNVVPGAMPARRPVVAAIPALTVRHTPNRAGYLRYLRAAATAWQTEARPADFTAGGVDEPLPDKKRVLVWLVPGRLPAPVDAWIRQGGTALLDAETVADAAPTVLWRDEVGAALVEGAPYGRGHMLRFVRPLIPSAMPQLLEPDFPAHLRALLTAPPAAPARVFARDHAPRTGGLTYPQRARDLRLWLALAIAGVLLIERWLATSRRRAVAP
jgi:hypothetical protein